MRGLAKKLILTLIIFVNFGVSFGTQVFANQVKTLSELRPGDTSVRLIIADQGETMISLAGHAAFRVVNEKQNFDYTANWGRFTISSSTFVENFINGKMIYSVGVYETSRFFRWYTQKENRTIYESELNLTNAQKRTLFKIIDWWLKPENQKYHHHLYYNNCSTIIRDILAQILGPNFTKIYQKSANTTIRKLTTNYFLYYDALPLLADILLNSEADKEITQWHFFLVPLLLPSLLQQSRAFDDHGQAIAQTTLMTAPKQIYQGSKIVIPKLRHGWYLTIFFALLLVMTFIFRKNRVFVAVGLSLYGLISAALGTVLLLAWLFTEHEVMWHNANLWFFWPIDCILIYWGLLLIRNKMNQQIEKSILLFFCIHGITFILALILMLTGSIQQNLRATYQFMLPSMLMVFFSWWYVKNQYKL